jgi:hypothetical protein
VNLLAIIDRYWSILGPRKVWIILAGLPFAVLLGINAFLYPPTYTARTVFHPDSGSNPLMGDATNPLSLILGNQAEGAQQGQMIEILQSRHINESVAADTIESEGERRMAANVILEMYDPGFSLVQWVIELFTGKPEPLTDEKRIKNAASIMESLLKAETTDNGFIVMLFSCKSQEIGRQLSYRYIHHLSQYYELQRTEKAKKNVEFFTQRADSVKRELDKVTYGLARNIDQNQFRIRATSEVYPSELRAKQEILKQMFITLTINREQAIAQLQQETPVIQVLDRPEPPYTRKGRSFIKFGVMGWFLGSFFLALFFVRNLLREDIGNLIYQILSGTASSNQQPE